MNIYIKKGFKKPFFDKNSKHKVKLIGIKKY